jgi:tripartite-type tricarboxylate transporter receptor subunit TctC
MMTRRRFMAAAAGGSALYVAGFAPRALAAPTIDKLARIGLGFPPGGSADIVARLLAERLRGEYAPNVIVENRPGGGGRTILEQSRGAEPDGSALVFTPSGMMTIFPHVYRKLGYEPFRDYIPVAAAGSFPFCVAAGGALPANVRTMADFIAWARANPQSASFGSPGAGSSPHFIGTMISQAGGVPLNHVPYKGVAPIVQDLLGSQIAVGIIPVGDAMQHLASGRLRVLAVTGPQRSRFMPEVPVMKEAGFADIDVEEVFGLYAPARTPADTVEKLSALARQAIQTPEMQARFAQLGLDSRSDGPGEFRALLRRHYDRWAPVVKASGFSSED